MERGHKCRQRVFITVKRESTNDPWRAATDGAICVEDNNMDHLA